MFDYTEKVNPDFINMMSEENHIFGILLNNAHVINIYVNTLCNILTRRKSLLYENH